MQLREYTLTSDSLSMIVKIIFSAIHRRIPTFDLACFVSSKVLSQVTLCGKKKFSLPFFLQYYYIFSATKALIKIVSLTLNMKIGFV